MDDDGFLWSEEPFQLLYSFEKTRTLAFLSFRARFVISKPSGADSDDGEEGGGG